MFKKELDLDPGEVSAIRKEIVASSASIASINRRICSSPAGGESLLPLIIEERRLKAVVARQTARLHSLNNELIASRRSAKLDYNIKILTDGNSNGIIRAIR